MTYPKRLIEVDLPIKRISAHARREKSIRHGHISTLHIWWARRPLAACRAVILAALWPDPADPRCPPRFLEEASQALKATLGGQTGVNVPKREYDDPLNVRAGLLDFIAEFANWDNATNRDYLGFARHLVQVAHESLGGMPGTRPLVVDPFAGGGSIPLEALRVGADAFASDLNPIPVLLNKVVLEYIPKYGQRLADEVRTWGQWIKGRAEEELAAFYPKDPDGATPIAYLWARTILSEAPGQGDVPVEVPLMRSLWLAKKASRRRALRWVRDASGQVQTETVEVAYVEDGQRVVKRVRRPLLEMFEPVRESQVEGGTVARGSATCPVTGYTTKVDRVRAQLKARRGGAADARLFCVVTTRAAEPGRFYRLPTEADRAAFEAAAAEMQRRVIADETQRTRNMEVADGHMGQSAGGPLSLVPDELISHEGTFRIIKPLIYGMDRWGSLFSPRQALALATFARLVRDAGVQIRKGHESGKSIGDSSLAEAVTTILAMQVGKQADLGNSLCRWEPVAQCPRQLFARQAVGMCWDFSEGVPTGDSSGAFEVHIERSSQLLDAIGDGPWQEGHVDQSSATNHPLPDDSASAFITDPPYYDSVAYAYLSDFFYVWLRRTLGNIHPALFREIAVPKDAEIIVDMPHKLNTRNKDVAFYEREMTKAFAEGRRVLSPSGVGTIVFASKTTASWEAILQAVIDAGFVITGSWPIDTEMETRVAAQGQARLASSVHLVCRPREDANGAVRDDEVGEWRDVLADLPKRIHQWMPRLAEEGVVGADAIFACLGPALELYSRFSRVEKANGEAVTLPEYLEQVWAAVSREALSLVFHDADTSGLEPDARLTAMWLWTLSTGTPSNGQADDDGDEDAGDDEDEAAAGSSRTGGFTLEFDAARKIAQGLGANLETLRSVIEVKGKTARLLPVSERSRSLFGTTNPKAPVVPRRSKRDTTEFLPGMEEVQAAEGSASGSPEDIGPFTPGSTALDRVHQSMLLFGTGRAEALKRFLVEDGIGRDPRFWKLAQSLSALYPPGTEEKRWVDGVLARKKGLGF